MSTYRLSIFERPRNSALRMTDETVLSAASDEAAVAQVSSLVGALPKGRFATLTELPRRLVATFGDRDAHAD